MRGEAACPEHVELSISRPDDLVLVENRDGAVVIRAMRDNFSPREKAFFIRYLAAEGFIPDLYRRYAEPDFEWATRVTWVVDRARLPLRQWQDKAPRDILRLVGWASLGWLALMVFAFMHAPR